MAHNLWHVTNESATNIMPITGQISWKSDILQLGDTLEFQIAYNDDRFFPTINLDFGHMIILENDGKELFRGTIIEEGRTKTRQYYCFDPAFNLNKSTSIFQFNNVAADIAIKQVLSRFDIPIGDITPINTNIKKPWYNDSPYSIISDILKQAEQEKGIKFRVEMRQAKLYIEKQEDLRIEGKIQIAVNTAPVDVTSIISNPSRTRSIQEMKNAIVIVYDDRIISQVRDDNLIGQFGLLERTETIDEKEIARANNIANNMLADLGKVFENNSVELLGHDDFRSGRIITINEAITGMSGEYLITSATHTINNGIHRMALQLGVT